MIVIGLAGHPSSGKDTSADYLEKKGYFHISLGDIIREEMKKSDLPINRPSMREFVINERRERGAYYPVDIACELLEEKTIITGFRNVAEVEYIRSRYTNEFVLIALEAPIHVRYERSLGRNREGDDVSFEKFKEHEEAERNSNPESHEVDNVLVQANYTIENTGVRPELYRKIDTLLEKLEV